MLQFNNNNNEFLNKRLEYLKDLLKDFETTSLMLSLSFIDQEDKRLDLLDAGAMVMSHIEFIKRCIATTKSLIKSNKEE